MSDDEVGEPEEAVREITVETPLIRMIKEGRVSSVEEVFNMGLKIREPEAIDLLLRKIREEVISMSPVQKQSDAGEKTRFRALVVVGDEDGHVGIGSAKAKQVRDAIEKAARKARLNIIPVPRGCGSWECKCGEPHSIPSKTFGKTGSVYIALFPGPKGLGLVVGDAAKPLFRLAGIRDVWSKTKGSTSTSHSFVTAAYLALKRLYTTSFLASEVARVEG
ncbi:MAG: 30S ribosomal protein S5 [Candidatus Brockarchaeota archaeon]|nr:30S ribosomal protein S5 [Candidatus Brockarchaeota archaeon]MBO3842178.1 30S ribosomal protein S5 [Candidatus Brockarchaeota archaeon]